MQVFTDNRFMQTVNKPGDRGRYAIDMPFLSVDADGSAVFATTDGRTATIQPAGVVVDPVPFNGFLDPATIGKASKRPRSIVLEIGADSCTARKLDKRGGVDAAAGSVTMPIPDPEKTGTLPPISELAPKAAHYQPVRMNIGLLERAMRAAAGADDCVTLYIPVTDLEKTIDGNPPKGPTASKFAKGDPIYLQGSGADGDETGGSIVLAMPCAPTALADNNPEAAFNLIGKTMGKLARD